jgi:hypothetical protein
MELQPTNIVKHQIRSKSLPFAAAVLALLGFGDRLSAVVLTFEGLGNREAVGNFYNGGLGGSGSGPGSNFGVTFSSNALAIIDSDAGGTGNFGGEPSPSTVLFFLTGNAATLNYAAGFDTGFSFFYSAIASPGFVDIYDGLGATGNILGSINLPVTPSDGGDPTGVFSPFVPIGVNFLGTARSINFGGAADRIAFDNITFGSATPDGGGTNPGTGVPDGGSTFFALGMGLLGLGGVRRFLIKA